MVARSITIVTKCCSWSRGRKKNRFLNDEEVKRLVTTSANELSGIAGWDVQLLGRSASKARCCQAET